MMMIVNRKDSRILVSVNHQLDDSSCTIFDMNCSKHHQLPSGYLTVRHGKSPFLIGKPVNHLFQWAMASMACPVSHNQRAINGGTYRYDLEAWWSPQVAAGWCHQYHNVRPPVISWLTKAPVNYSYKYHKPFINHSYWSYVIVISYKYHKTIVIGVINQLSYLGGLTLHVISITLW